MEVTNNRQGMQTVFPSRQCLPERLCRKRKELPPSVAIKAASVPEFEKLDIDQAIADLQAFVEGLGRSLSFARDESIDRSVITVRDTQTNQVVRQIPSEEVVAIARQIREEMVEMRSGILMDKNA